MIFFVILFAFIFSGCSSQTPLVSDSHQSEFEGSAMTIPYRIVIGSSLSVEEKSLISHVLHQVFAEVDSRFNNWNPQSEISRLNRLKANEKVKLSPAMHSFLKETEAVVKLTHGLFDPTIQPLHKLWAQKLSQGEVPSNRQIQELLPAIGWDKVHFEEAIFFKDHDDTAIDLGGNAKGHCIDLLVERLTAAGWKNLYVEWGGEIRVSGQHPDQRPWRVFISSLGDRNPENGYAEINLIDQALATSGDYLQYWSVNIDGKRVSYSHIIDPRTYLPIIITPQSTASASVMAPNCALADGIATALMLLSVDDSVLLIDEIERQFPGCKGWVYSRDSQKNKISVQ